MLRLWCRRTERLDPVVGYLEVNRWGTQLMMLSSLAALVIGRGPDGKPDPSSRSREELHRLLVEPLYRSGRIQAAREMTLYVEYGADFIVDVEVPGWKDLDPEDQAGDDE